MTVDGTTPAGDGAAKVAAIGVDDEMEEGAGSEESTPATAGVIGVEDMGGFSMRPVEGMREADIDEEE